MRTEIKDEPGKAKSPKEEGPRSFSHFLATVSGGEAEMRLSYELHELGLRLQEEVKDQGRKVKGELKLVVKLEAEVNGTVTVSYSIDAKEPKSLTTPALFWMTPGGNLSLQDQRQMELKPREVPAPTREVRDVPAHQDPKEIF